MRAFASVIVVGAALLLVAAGCQATGAQSPSPASLASGTFMAKGANVTLDATGGGDNVSGSMTVSHETGNFTVDLKCARTAEDGRILIGGDTTDSASSYATKGTRTAIVLKPGSPVHATFAFEEAGRPAASCTAFLDDMSDEPFATTVGPDALEPIEGTVELGS